MAPAVHSQGDALRPHRWRPTPRAVAMLLLAGLVVRAGGVGAQSTEPTAPTPSLPTPPAAPAPSGGAMVTVPPATADANEWAGASAAATEAPVGTLVPPNVEAAPVPTTTGGYCYSGPHPVDTRVSPGAPWDDQQGQHLHPYPPIDLRLFAYQDGCYYFVGDPRDFGYGGSAYSYYGAHPILPAYGGGWCFMMGGHSHQWRPWSTQFTVVGPWYYWAGPFDPVFWTYWPYYSFYYRTYYPHYYGGGRFYRGGWTAAPPIGSRWHGSGAFRGTPPFGGGPSPRGAPAVRGTPPGAVGPRGGFGGWDSRSATGPFRGTPQAPSRPAYVPTGPAFRGGPGVAPGGGPRFGGTHGAPFMRRR